MLLNNQCFCFAWPGCPGAAYVWRQQDMPAASASTHHWETKTRILIRIGTVLVLWQPAAYTSDQLSWFTVVGFQFLSGEKVGESRVFITVQKLCFVTFCNSYTKRSKMASLENNSIWLFWKEFLIKLLKAVFFIGPESDHWECLSVSNSLSLTDSLTPV